MNRSSRILIVADDLTGGNACGALFAEAGLRVLTLAGASGLIDGRLDEALDEFDVVVVNAESRHLPPARAAEVTERIVRSAGSVDLAACRIDTTLRGNVGSSAEALLGARRSSAGDRRVLGLCVPAFPSADRVTVGGRQLLGGKLLESTELATDVRSPMTTSVVGDILTSHSRLRTWTIPLEDVLSGNQALRDSLLRGIESGSDVIVCDALTTDHVDFIAQVAGRLSAELDLEWAAIDPGPGSLALARAVVPAQNSGVLLGVSGSATEITRAQLAKLAEDPSVRVLRAVLDADALPDVKATVERVRATASAAGPMVKAIIVATVVDASDLRELTPEQSELLPRRLAQITRAVLEEEDVSGLYTTGGDVTAAVLSELGAEGMELDAEIIPLAVGGRISGGAHSGVPIVTKGGLIGDSTTAALCLDHLKQAARLSRATSSHRPATTAD